MNDKIIIKGAKEHNLKNINLEIPRDKLVVVTGLSGSGKSSLAFDTLYAEGQRRYVESLSSYARQFLGLMEKPDVESIEGLSPAISIDQKTTSKNPRSTVGTVTEIYDYIRLLYARIGVPYCPICGKKIEKQTIDQIIDNIMKLDEGTKIQVIAPIVRGRKGEYTKLIQDLLKEGFIRARIDGENVELSDDIQIDRKKKHNIDLIVDRLVIKPEIRSRLTESVEIALKHADNIVMIDVPSKGETLYSQNYACPDCGFSFPELTPRMFSFNNPQGACPECTGIGYLMKMDEDLIIPDKNKTLYDGVKAFGSSTEEMMKKGGVMNNLRDVEIEDLLGRDTIKLDNKNITDLIKGKNVLVTGGGGSIGSELCRQIMKYNPAKLIIFDIYENNLYDIQMELDAHYPKTKIEAIVGSVRDKERLRKVFEKYSPKLVFHAAAHKHVPLMENSPLEAIKNNIFGTYNVANCADEFGVERFVLISTDKAVNPTNIMGASKRVCEMIIQAKNKVSKTDYVAVRFGNVLGSNGSVIPLFKKQIAEGGPVTVTHKDITRFFMTIPEAVGLILQAITYAEGGEIFVLDMGKPVKIYDLAISLIKLSGYEPGVDIPIQFTGLREGEKLYEELLMAEEGLTATKHNKIFVSQPMNLGMEELESKLNKLSKIKDNDMNLEEEVKQVMKQVVPTYKEPDEVNKKIVNEKKGTNENTQKVEATANT